MRLLGYNILDGGTGRTDLLARIIADRKPDVVALVEADDTRVVQDLAGRLGMDFIHAPGNKKASALLSRFSIRETINHAPLHPALTKSLLEATVIDPSGTEWVLGVLHLHARATEEDEKTREREIEEVLKVFEPHRQAGRPHLLAGDFNSNAPYQRIDPARCKPGTREAFERNGGYIPRRVIQRVLEAGYSDSLRARDPSAAENAGSFSTEFPGQRVDYVFTFGIDPKRIRSAQIVYEEPGREASDHFPVAVEID
jgi:endonuclease/exonuclease/phosphatase family metal-dependent hydrolase